MPSLDTMPTTSNTPPQISVLLPVYNGAAALGNTVNHILRQTFTDFELLMLDDGSTDESLQVMQNFAATDHRIRVISQKPNAGIVTALNRLASEAQGEILLREDCGDFSAPNRYELQVKALSSHPEASACVTGSWLLDHDGNPLGVNNVPSSSETLLKIMQVGNVVAHSSLAMRKAVFDRVGGYDPTAVHAEDYDLLIKLLKQGPIIPLPEPLGAYTLNPTGITFKNLPTQAAHSAKIRALHFGSPMPTQLHFPALSKEESELAYHTFVGRLHLFKGNPSLARPHLEKAYKMSPSNRLRLLRLMTFMPSAGVKLLRKMTGKADPKPFFQ